MSEHTFSCEVVHQLNIWLEILIVARNICLPTVLHDIIELDNFFCIVSLTPENAEASEFLDGYALDKIIIIFAFLVQELDEIAHGVLEVVPGRVGLESVPHGVNSDVLHIVERFGLIRLHSEHCLLDPEHEAIDVHQIKRIFMLKPLKNIHPGQLLLSDLVPIITLPIEVI